MPYNLKHANKLNIRPMKKGGKYIQGQVLTTTITIDMMTGLRLVAKKTGTYPVEQVRRAILLYLGLHGYESKTLTKGYEEALAKETRERQWLDEARKRLSKARSLVEKLRRLERAASKRQRTLRG